MKSVSLKYWIFIGIALLAGLAIGSFLFDGKEVTPTEEVVEELEESTTWTCSMHPQIRQPEPGQCPICGMDLIPVSEDADEGELMAVQMSETAARLANIQTMRVGMENAAKTIRLNGRVVPNERLVKTQSAHISGRIEQLLVNTTGEQVRQGQLLARVYSPELVSAQRELLQAYAIRESQPAIYEAAREKLRALRISQNQIEQIIQSGEVQESLGIYADRSGIVLEKMVNVGDYLERGEALFTIADLSNVWVVFDAYESDLSFLDEGDRLKFTVASIPGQTFEGEITFIDPVVDPQTRTAEVRVETNNPNRRLKPEMFATATVEAQLGDGEQLVVPKSAVMWTGERSVVYVKVPNTEQPSFRLREVELGPALGNAYVIEEGLEAGEQVVINGTFTVDAAAQLAGKPSMMNPAAGAMMKDHDHAEMQTDPDMEQVEISAAQKSEITALLQAYFQLKDALVASDEKQAARHARSMEEKLNDIEMASMAEAAHQHWMHILPKLKATLKEINSKANIDSQRKAFVPLSEAVVEIARSFGPFEQAVYVMHCPMANEDKGANWLSTTEEVLNPYYGDLMLRCGEVTQEIQ